MVPQLPVLEGPVRIVRSNGATRQSFETENVNRMNRILLGEQSQVTISYEHDNADAENARDGRLKVIPERPLKHNVPFECSEGKFTYEDAPNPVNMVGGLLEDNIPVVTSNDFASFISAFSKRCDFDGGNDDCKDDVYNEAMALVDSLPDDMFPTFVEDDGLVQRWMDKFGPEKQQRMRDGELLIDSIDAFYLGSKDLSVKIEVLLKRSDPEWAPRIIYAGNDAFNRVSGPAVMVAMERLQEVLEDKSNQRLRAHKLGVVEAKLCYKTVDTDICDFLEADPSLKFTYEGDFSANDKEQRKRVALITDLWLKKMCMPQWLRTLFLEMQSFRVVNRRFGVKSKIRYQLPTGTTLTTFRNSVYNLTMFAVACARQGIRKARASILGDDILCVTSQPFCVHKWKECVDRFRMKLKGKNVRIHGEATLLSRRLCYIKDSGFMLPLIGKALARFNARANMTDMSDDTYVAGKALSYAYEFRHVPFMRNAFMKRFQSIKTSESSKVTLDDLTWFTRSSGFDMNQIMHAINNERVTIEDDQFRDFLMEVYGFGLCDMQELLDLTVLNPITEYVSHPAVSKLSIDW